ncbi:hypothetical protein Goari_018140, partial [Gossypium aridum]|nr:hypothetical protein [Gossypium aridum]
GTRFTEARLLAAQEYAVSQGLPIPRNVLVPPIYDLTVAIPKTSPSPTLLRFCNGQSSVVYIHIKRRLMKQLPETDEAVAQRCKDIFVEKMITTTTEQFILDFYGNAAKSIAAVITSWACIVAYGILKFLQWSSLLSSWKGIALSAYGLAIVSILMQILILFTQSERSNPAAKVAPRKPPKNDPQSPNSLWKLLLA